MTSQKKISGIVFFVLCAASLLPFVHAPLALAAGFLFSFLLGNPYSEQSGKYIHYLLQACIVGLGFSLQLSEAVKAGQEGFLLTIGGITLVFLLGWLLGKALKINRPLSYLISAGTAICGGSAIAAVSPIVKPSHRDLSVALAVIFVLNSVALFVYPAVGHYFQLSQDQFGLWCAVGIHDTSSVVGAASRYGAKALSVATTVKLARTL